MVAKELNLLNKKELANLIRANLEVINLASQCLTPFEVDVSIQVGKEGLFIAVITEEI